MQENLASLFLQIIHGIDTVTVDDDLEMQMGTRGVTRGACSADHLTLRYLIAHLHVAGIQMRVGGDHTVCMLDLDHVPPADIAQELEKLEGVIRVRVIC